MRDPIPVFIHLLRAKDVIDREFARELDVSTLAREAHASIAHFARGFQRAFGETPHQYLRRRRIERAGELLRGGELSVTAISLEVGFHSLGSFSTAHRARGAPPGRDRRPHRAPAGELLARRRGPHRAGRPRVGPPVGPGRAPAAPFACSCPAGRCAACN